MRVDTTKDQMGSLLFPERPNQANQMLVPASNVAVYGTSVDHPLSVAGVVAIDRPLEVADRLRPSGASQMPQQHKAPPTHTPLHPPPPPSPAPYPPPPQPQTATTGDARSRHLLFLRRRGS